MQKYLASLTVALVASACSMHDIADMGDVETPSTSASRGVQQSSDAATHRYEVTIENLTTGQPLSPGVVAIHTAQDDLFSVGSSASEGIRLIAENGDPGTGLAEAMGLPGASDAVATSAPVGCNGCGGPFGNTLTVELEARANANRLSLAVMLICTNDGFVGLDGVRLPGGSRPATYMAEAYDAGTERNDELLTSIVDPCGAIGPVPFPADGFNNRPATMGAISHHPGIAGVGDLTAAHDWSGPVARVTVQRIN